MTDTAAEEWKRWTEARTASVSAPHGPLALVGTHWLDVEPSALPELPGRWWAADGLVQVSASAADGIRLEHADADDAVIDGQRGLRPDTMPGADRATVGDRRLVPIERDGELALRVFDPASPVRRAFAGISVYPYAPEWAVPAVFSPFDSGEQSVLVPNADGRKRALELTGRIAFTLAGRPYALTVSRAGNRLSGVIADATSGAETYPFRFITLPAPDGDGNTVLDLNRAFLPPCAFADHFVCPFPPPGNRLPIAVEAGEKQVLSR